MLTCDLTDIATIETIAATQQWMYRSEKSTCNLGSARTEGYGIPYDGMLTRV